MDETPFRWGARILHCKKVRLPVDSAEPVQSQDVCPNQATAA